jgi:uncharacterized repeat protein (TIGR03837 family)
MQPPLRWDIFCRVIDNHGDVGVCWRLACGLAARGGRVRLWLDDASALRWMAPEGAAGVEVLNWQDASTAPQPQDVVIEAFGCDPPPAFVAAMAGMPQAPLWINLEYLSAEAYVERSHGLPSPQLQGPGSGLTKWFFYPGFNSRTGGLLREPGLIEAQQKFDRRRWLAALGVQMRDGERVVSVFAYPQAPWGQLVQALADRPTLLLLTPGAAQQGLSTVTLPPGVRRHSLPWLAQVDYDHLLWSSDINLVRGEDSAVRAMWAGVPFLWQLYPQHDGAHANKLDAFARAFGADAVPGLQAAWQRWNGLGAGPLQLPEMAPWQSACRNWRDSLLQQPDLCTQLLGFVRSKAGARC